MSKTNQQVSQINPTVLSPIQEKNKSFFKEEKVKSIPKEEKNSKLVVSNKTISKEEKVTAEVIKPKKERKSRDSTSGSESAKTVNTNNTASNQSKLPEESPATSAKPQPEPIRANVKRTLQELLNQRIKADPELNNTNEDVSIYVNNWIWLICCWIRIHSLTERRCSFFFVNIAGLNRQVLNIYKYITFLEKNYPNIAF